MKSLLLSFPENLISESDKAADQLGISRSEFIRKSVVHELQELAKNTRENNIISSFTAFKSNPITNNA